MTIERTKAKKIAVTLLFFFIAGLCEIGGGYLVWLWLRDGMSWMLGALGGFVLFLYGVVPTFQQSHFHRIYAAYGGIFIGIAPDRFDIVGSVISLAGVAIIFYMPRKGEEKALWSSK
jgi:small multidrug resistance family-3 protein